MKSENIERTPSNKTYGEFNLFVMQMNVCSKTATFQILINEIVHDCMDKCVMLCNDDIIYFSEDKESKYKYVKIVCERLQDSQQYSSPGK